MHRATSRVLICVALCVACENTDSGEDEDRSRGNVLLLDEHNYSSTSSLTVPTVETASGADLDICWGDVDSDIQCHDLDPQGDLDTVALLRFLHLSEEEVEAELTSGQIAQSEVDGYLDYETDHESTCTKLSSLTLFGTEIDVEEEYAAGSDRTYLLLLTEGTTPGVGARSMVFLEPSENSTNTRVEVERGCGFLEFSAELTSAEPVSIPKDGPWVIDWRDVTEDSQGYEIVYEAIDGVVIGFFEGKTVAELEAQILDLELIATSLWELELEGGRTADLADATGRDGGGSFPGFERDEDGVWLLALTCSTCQNPAPIVLAVLEPSEED